MGRLFSWGEGSESFLVMYGGDKMTYGQGCLFRISSGIVWGGGGQMCSIGLLFIKSHSFWHTAMFHEMAHENNHSYHQSILLVT